MEDKFLAPESGAEVDDSPCVLLVDDYGPNCMVAGIYLEQFGYRCEIAENGLQALEKVKQQKFHAILMDVQMHDMNGHQATRAIRQYEQESNAPRTRIIGITAHSRTEDRDKCLESGMDDYLSKPYFLEDLKTKLSF
ncbi:MAG: response regulator [Micavibrio sp.]